MVVRYFQGFTSCVCLFFNFYGYPPRGAAGGAGLWRGYRAHSQDVHFLSIDAWEYMRMAALLSSLAGAEPEAPGPVVVAMLRGPSRAHDPNDKIRLRGVRVAPLLNFTQQHQRGAKHRSYCISRGPDPSPDADAVRNTLQKSGLA
jgi:hypothetical protein